MGVRDGLLVVAFEKGWVSWYEMALEMRDGSGRMAKDWERMEGAWKRYGLEKHRWRGRV
jgi:hypothetical protein